jgi:hypothetical protein
MPSRILSEQPSENGPDRRGRTTKSAIYAHVATTSTAVNEIHGRTPRLFITDHEPALKNRLAQWFDVPQRACLWHLMKNLECKVLKIWGENKALRGPEEKYKELKNDFMLRFTEMVNATTEDDFDDLYAWIKTDYTTIPYILAYIEDNMMLLEDEWAEYICQYMPGFGQRTTSRLKSSHGKLKRVLVNRTGHSYDILKDIHQLIRRDRNTHKVLVDAAENRVTTRHNVEAFQRLHTTITLPGLELLREQYDLAKVQLSKADMPGYVPQVCSGAFEAQFDMPCVHLLPGMMQEDGNLTLQPTQIGQH